MVSGNMHPRLLELYHEHFGAQPSRTTELRAHGSDRKLYRLQREDGPSVIGVEHADRDENRAFIAFSRHFRHVELPVPEIYREDLDAGVYLEEDLGDATLFSLLQQERGPAAPVPSKIAELYAKAVRTLIRFQTLGLNGLDLSLCHPHDTFGRRSMTWDLNYFKYYFLKPAQVSFHEQRLENDFDALCGYLLSVPAGFLMHRDYQSRNIMIRDGEPWLIDYQGCRRGAPHYDLASLLLDAKANLPFEFREQMKQLYLAEGPQSIVSDPGSFEQQFRGFSLIRTLQAMGAYGYRGFYERKTHFLQSVPFALRNLEHLLEGGPLPVELPELWTALRGLIGSSRLRTLASTPPPLTVRVESFSYKHGYPADDSGHGGGFVFDCRALPNPGREARFVSQTGLDPEVISWLSSHEELASFLAQIRALLTPTLDSYQKRGFTHLSVSFGCTGGRHRSVYCAQAISRWLQNRSGVVVDLRHREEPSWTKAAVSE